MERLLIYFTCETVGGQKMSKFLWRHLWMVPYLLISTLRKIWHAFYNFRHFSAKVFRQKFFGKSFDNFDLRNCLFGTKVRNYFFLRKKHSAIDNRSQNKKNLKIEKKIQNTNWFTQQNSFSCVCLYDKNIILFK